MVQTIGWCPDGRHLVSYGHDRAVRIWEATTGHTRSTVHLNALSRLVCFSPDGTRLAMPSRGVRGQSNWVTIIETATAAEVVTYTGHAASIVSLAWSPGGRAIASADKRGGLSIWETSTGVPLGTYHGPATARTSLAWSPDGTRIALGGRSGNVQIFDASTGKPLLTARPHTRPVQMITWSPDGQRIASGVLDRTVEVWRPV